MMRYVYQIQMHRNGQQLLVSRAHQFIYFHSENNMATIAPVKRVYQTAYPRKNSKLKSVEDPNFT